MKITKNFGVRCGKERHHFYLVPGHRYYFDYNPPTINIKFID